MSKTIKMTSYSHGAGCGCKISPKVLTSILETDTAQIADDKLLVGYDSRDDAAVYDMGDGTAIISTTDFFLPIVDDPFTFGQIAACNAISDVYAMGGKPLMAIAILGWPISKIPAEVAAQVMEGGRKACREAGIILAGGHSIDNPEPVFGLAVTGRVDISNMKRNDKARANSKLYITKPLGVGVLATAQKNGVLKEEHQNIASDSMLKLNALGYELGKIDAVSALTDVTGFGLMGHLLEICEGSGVSAVIEYDKVPVFEPVKQYLKLECIPGGTVRNWDSYGHKLTIEDKEKRHILCDPQTSGGLLIAVDEEAAPELERLLKKEGLIAHSIGRLTDKNEENIKIV